MCLNFCILLVVVLLLVLSSNGAKLCFDFLSGDLRSCPMEEENPGEQSILEKEGKEEVEMDKLSPVDIGREEVKEEEEELMITTPVPVTSSNLQVLENLQRIRKRLLMRRGKEEEEDQRKRKENAAVEMRKEETELSEEEDQKELPEEIADNTKGSGLKLFKVAEEEQNNPASWAVTEQEGDKERKRQEEKNQQMTTSPPPEPEKDLIINSTKKLHLGSRMNSEQMQTSSLSPDLQITAREEVSFPRNFSNSFLPQQNSSSKILLSQPPPRQDQKELQLKLIKENSSFPSSLQQHQHQVYI